MHAVRSKSSVIFDYALKIQNVVPIDIAEFTIKMKLLILILYEIVFVLIQIHAVFQLRLYLVSLFFRSTQTILIP